MARGRCHNGTEWEKMGPRIREDKGFTGTGVTGTAAGSPHPRGQGRARVILHFALTRLGLGHSILCCKEAL